MKPKNEQIPFISLNANDDLPMYQKICLAIRQSILDGNLAAKTRLPSTRNLAYQLGVSRITVVNAFEQLLAEGYLEGKTGSGTFVAKELPENLLQTKSKTSKITAKPTTNELRLSVFGKKVEAENVFKNRLISQTKFVPFQNGLTAIDEFPFEIWSRITNRIIRNPKRNLLGYGDAAGYFPLREAIAKHLTSARGVNCTAEQVFITSGAQQALYLAAGIFLERGDSIVIEEPCYLEARNVFSANDAKIISVEVDNEGLNAANIPSDNKIKLAYVTPSHQYPLGVTMSLSRRLALLEWAKKNNAWIIEDDYNSEFRYAGRPIESLQGLDKSGRVIYVGTFSKTIFPGLRIGCLVLPSNLVGIFSAAKNLIDVHSPMLEQAVLAEFINEGHFSRHIRRMRTLYQKRQEILLENCEKYLKDFVEIKKADAGMHLVGFLHEHISDSNLFEKGLEKDLKLSPLSNYYTNFPKRNGIIFGYTAFNEKEISNAIKQIAEIFEKP